MKNTSLLLLSLWLFFTNFSFAQKEIEEKEAKVAENLIIYVGTLKKNYPKAFRNPSEYLLEDGFFYKSTDYSVDHLNLYSKESKDLSAFEGKLVQVYGLMDQDLNKVTVALRKASKAQMKKYRSAQKTYETLEEEIEELPEEKKEEPVKKIEDVEEFEVVEEEEFVGAIRNDWVGEETGFTLGQSTKEKLKSVSFLRYQKVEAFTSLTILKQEKEVHVTFTNTFGVPVTNLTLGAHYESLFTKPVPHNERHNFKTLAAGKTVTFSFPKRIKLDREYGMTNIFVRADGEYVRISIESKIK